MYRDRKNKRRGVTGTPQQLMPITAGGGGGGGLINLCTHDRWILNFDWGPPYQLNGCFLC